MNKCVNVIIPFPFDEKGIANRRAQLPNEFIRPGFEVEFVPVRNSCAYGDSYYDTLVLKDEEIFSRLVGMKSS